MKQVCGRVLSNSQVLPGVYLLWTRAPEIAASAEPGQFVMVRCGAGFEPLLRRPLSIHRVSDRDALALLFAVVGRGTKWLSQRREGETLDLLGPLGKGFEIHPASKNLLLVAGGIGVAPLVALTEAAIAAGRAVTLLLGAETSSQVYPSHLLPPGLKVVVTTADGSLGDKGLVTDPLPLLAAGADQILACGPIPMYKAMATLSRKQIFEGKSVQVLLEQVMGCGVGACRSCTVETKQGLRRVCQHGPVFELSEVIWEELTEPRSGG